MTDTATRELAIVIPSYKDIYLRQTLQSIACQTDRRFTLYIGSDASPYDLESIVDEFRDRIHIVYHRFETNLGASDLVGQWERCISLTQGEPYLWLFSDDDLMEPDCVATYLALPEEFRSSALFHFNLKVIDSTADSDKCGCVSEAAKYPSRLDAREYIRAKLTGRIISFVVEFVFPRKLYDKAGGVQNFDMAWGADFMTWVKMAAEAPLGIISEPQSENAAVIWRKSDSNISPDKSHDVMIRKLNAVIDNAAFLKSLFRHKYKTFFSLRPRFRWLRFPLGDIYRARDLLTREDIRLLTKAYMRKVGFIEAALLTRLLANYRRSHSPHHALQS